MKKRYLLLPFLALIAMVLPSLKSAIAWQAYFSQTGNDSLLNSQLAKKAIYNNDFVRNTFYTWTSLNQVNQMRGSKVLLTKSKSETRGYSEFDLALRDSTFKDNPVSKVLCEDMFAKKRFAWTNPWATVMGWENENYGNQLIKIVLKEDAIIGLFSEIDKKNPFAFYNMKGNKLEIKDALAQKDKIAAVYHIGLVKTTRLERKWQGTYMQSDSKEQQDWAPYREYVILNSSMIKYWAYGTDDILEEMKAEVILLTKVSDNCKGVVNGSKFYNSGNYLIYADSHKDDDLSSLYFACACFENDFYLLNKKRLDAIISTLKKCIKAQAQPITAN